MDQPADPTPHEVMTRYARDAVSYAKEVHSIDLDFSMASLAAVHSIVETLHADRPRGLLAWLTGQAPSADEIKMISLILGGYAGEAYRRANGGEWRLEESTGACGVVAKGVWIFSSDYVAPSSPSLLKR